MYVEVSQFFWVPWAYMYIQHIRYFGVINVNDGLVFMEFLGTPYPLNNILNKFKSMNLWNNIPMSL